MFHITDDYGTAVYFDDEGDLVTCEGCIDGYDRPQMGSCGDCYGGTDRDPYVNGSVISWQERQSMVLAECREAGRF